MKKLKNLIPALGLAVLPFLSQVTMSGGTVALESNEISSISDAVVGGYSSLLNLNLQLIPTAVMITVIGAVIGLIAGFGHLKNWLGKRRKRR